MLYFNEVALDLQLFAEGGTGAAAASTGESAAPLEGVSAEAEVQDAAEQTIDRNAEYEKFLKDYKDLDDARVQKIVQRRVRGMKETVDRYNNLSPMLEMLANKYGTKVGDIDGLTKAIENDDSYYEQEALDKGVTVEQLKEFKRVERENAQLVRQMEEMRAEENSNRILAGWMEQAEAAKAKYPSLNLNEELNDEQFVSLLKSGIDVETAYTVVHKDEIIPAAMQYAVKTAESKLSKSVQAGTARPRENGAGAQSAAIVKNDVSHSTKQQRDEWARLAARGERITFDH